MRKSYIVIYILIQSITTYSQQTPYKIKSAKIDFVWSNGISKGTKSLVFDDFGKVEKLSGVEYVDTSLTLREMLGENFSDTSLWPEGAFPKDLKFPRSIIHSLLIQTKDSVFSIDLDDKIGSSQGRTYWDIQSLFPPEKKIGEVQFLGKTCNIVQTPVGKMLMWKGICVYKTYDDFPDPSMYEYAVAIDEDYVINGDEFKVPRDIEMK